ncbi:MAG TPA: CaiB/BaiF CoA-transferase family protein [Acidimicrobiales bacterium]|nr:CaiB/BaiF CoA-transferase family protein [Acidimicrobiales bacterium]
MTGAGPLNGVRVLDLSRVLAGPHCGRMLVDLGADVIKVEPPEGDLTRFSYPRKASMASYFAQQNCGKRNVSLDLTRPEAVSIVRSLAGLSDVVLENFRPGVMARMGLDPDELLAEHPHLVIASISGYGQQGPWSRRRAYAPVVQAEAGITWAQGQARHGVMANDVFSHGDVYTALECLSAVLAALYQREKTGVGQRVDIAMAETMLTINEHAHWHLNGGDVNNQVPSFAPGDYPVIPTAEGHHIVISGHPAGKGTFDLYMRAAGRTDLIDDPRFATVDARVEHLDEIIEVLAEWSSSFDDIDAIEDTLAEHGLAMGVLRTVSEISHTDWAEARGAIVEVDDRSGGTLRLPNSPWRFSAADTGVRGVPAYRGEHNREVLRELLDVSEPELDRLEADGVLSSRPPRG